MSIFNRWRIRWRFVLSTNMAVSITPRRLFTDDINYVHMKFERRLPMLMIFLFFDILID